MKLFDADGEVHVGDVVRYGRKVCFVEKIGLDGLISIVTMDERKYLLRVKPEQIDCVIQKEEN